MALALVGGAAIGALFGALYDVVKESIGRTVLQYKPLLGDLKFTLDSLRPRIVQQIGDHNVELGLPNDDIESLQRQMEEGIVLVRKLSNIGMWNCYVWCSCCNSTKASYSDQLVELDRSLRILLEILKLQEARDVKEVLLLARKIHDKQDDLERRMSDLLKVQQEAGDVGGSSGSNTGTTIQQGNGGNGGHQVAPLGGVGGAAALGAVFGVLFDTVEQVKDKTMMLKCPLGDIKSTLDSLKPLIEEMAEYNKVLNLPNKELENVRFQMEKGVELLHKCSKVRRWTSYKRNEYANELLGLDESLQGLLNILRQQLARDVRESLVSVSNIEKVIDQIEGSGTVQLQNDPIEIEDPCEVLEPPQPEVGLSVQGTRYVKETLDSAVKIEVGVKRIEGSGDVQGQTYMGIAEPTLPTVEAPDAENEVTEFVPSTVTVGLDVLLRELKRELLKDEVSALVLTGPRGCGKTTLAKNFCHDEEVKNIFKNSIFFVRVSKRPNLSLIVRKLYQQIEHKGSLIPELQENTIALKWLQVFLKETGQHPSLLVLDDVWPGSEPILDKFDKFKTSNYKILVTSRSEFPTFGSPYYLQSLNDEGQMTLSHHSRSYSFESLDDEDLVCVSPATSFTAMDDDPTAYFRDFSTSYLEDRISHVSEDANPMAHFHDSSASTVGDRSSYVSKDVGTKFPLGSPVKSTQTNMPRKLGAKVSAGDKIMKKVMKAVHGIKEVSSACWDARNQSPFRGGGQDVQDRLLWFRDFGKYAWGDFSMAVVQANNVLEDQSQIESGPFGTFVGVYDGHGGPEAARYVCDNLFRHFQAISAESDGVVTAETIRKAFLRTEEGFTALVSELWSTRPNVATVGSCCLVGVICQRTLFVANLGGSRVVLGKKMGNTGEVAAIQLSTEHTANLEEVRHELKDLHPNDPQIVVFKHGVWRVKGIIGVSKSIGDVYMKHAEFNREPIAAKFRLPEPMHMPILSANPTILSHPLHPDDSFLIFASDGLWENLSNEKAVEIVHKHPHAGSAKRLVQTALQEAARKSEMRYSDLRKIEKGIRRHFHDDITVIVLFLNHDLISRGMVEEPPVSISSAVDH